MPSNPKNKALKRVTERVKGALKGNNSVPRGAVAKKDGRSGPIRAVEKKRAGGERGYLWSPWAAGEKKKEQ